MLLCIRICVCLLSVMALTRNVHPSELSQSNVATSNRRLAMPEILPQQDAVVTRVSTDDPAAMAWYGIGSQWQKMDNSVSHWLPRSQFGSLVHNGTAFLMGGLSSAGNELNDVWAFDGIHWKLKKETAEWQPRRNFALVEHLGYIYILGGRTQAGLVNDVWRGTVSDTEIFFEQTKGVDFNSQLAFSTREKALALSFRGKMYMFGGCRDGSIGTECAMSLKRVLESSHGETWSRSILQDGQAANLPDFFANTPYQLMGVTTDAAMLVLGGNTVAALRVLPAGALAVEQVRSGANTGWELGRAGVALRVASLVFVLGGATEGGGRSNRIRFSHDGGSSWQDIPSPSQQELLFPPRTDSSGVVLGGRLCLFGGVAGSVTFADVWCSIKPTLPQPALTAHSIKGDGARSSDHWHWDTVRWELTPAPAPLEVEETQHVSLSLQWGLSAPTVSGYNGPVEWTLPDNEVDVLVTAEATVAVGSDAPLRGPAQVTWVQARVRRALADPEIDSLEPKFPLGETAGTVRVACPRRGIVPIEAVACSTHPPNRANSSQCWQGEGSVQVRVAAGESLIRAQCSAEDWPISDVVVWTVRPLLPCRDHDVMWMSLGAGVVVTSLDPDATTSVPATEPSSTSSSLPPTTTPIPTPPPTSPPPAAVIESATVCCGLSCYGDADDGSCTHLNTSGGSRILIRGQGLGTVRGISVGERECGGITCEDGPLSESSHCTCVAPPGLAVASLSLLLADGTRIHSPLSLPYAAPRMRWLYPRHGVALGGSAVTVSGDNMGAVLVGGSAEGAGEWEVAGYVVHVAVGETRARRVEWRSDTSMVVRTEGGVGAALPVVLTVARQTVTVPQRFSYDAPEVLAAVPPFGPQEGGLEVTIVGRNFGKERTALGAEVAGAACLFTLWFSDSSASCSFPPHQGLGTVPIRVGAGDQWGEMQEAYAYTGASDAFSVTTSASPSELLDLPAGSGKRRLEELREWLQGSLALPLLAQVYVARVEPVVARRGAGGARVVLRILGSRAAPTAHQEALAILAALVQRGSAAFASSFVPITRVALPGTPEIVLGSPDLAQSHADSATLDDSGGGGAGGGVVAVAVGVCGGVLGVAGLALYLRRQGRASWDMFESPPPEPRADSVFMQPTPSFRTARTPSFRQDSIKSKVGDTPRKGGSDAAICDQCQRSGFRVCVHSGIARQESLRRTEEEREDTTCVVCLDSERTALVIHDDDERTAHQVLCLSCARRILAEGGTCPMCRKPILEVCQAGLDI